MPLDDTGLVVRYYIDEAASGSAPSAVLDGSGVGSAFDLTIDYGGGNLAYTEVSGQRGLNSTSTTGTQKARKTLVTADKVITALNGVTNATCEIVLNLATFSASGGRIFGLQNRTGSNGTFILKGTGGTNWLFSINNTDSGAQDFVENARQVFHFVFDSTQAVQADRLKVSVDGATLAALSNTIALNETLAVDNTLDLIMFNRESSGSYDRSITGTLFYAALYSVAFTQTQVNTNYAVLTADDDTPAAGGTAITPPVGSGTLTGAGSILGTGITPGTMIAGT